MKMDKYEWKIIKSREYTKIERQYNVNIKWVRKSFI